MFYNISKVSFPCRNPFNIIYNYRYNIISSEFSVLNVDTYVKILILNYLFSIKFHGVMVNIPDFLFGALSLSLDETYFL